MEQHKIELALDSCYDAILAPDTWPLALHELARSLDAACALFYPRNPDTHSQSALDPDRPLAQMPTSPDCLELLEEYVRNQWYLNHYRAARGFPLLDSGRTVVVEHDLATDRHVENGSVEPFPAGTRQRHQRHPNPRRQMELARQRC